MEKDESFSIWGQPRQPCWTSCLMFLCVISSSTFIMHLLPSEPEFNTRRMETARHHPCPSFPEMNLLSFPCPPHSSPCPLETCEVFRNTDRIGKRAHHRIPAFPSSNMRLLESGSHLNHCYFTWLEISIFLPFLTYSNPTCNSRPSSKSCTLPKYQQDLSI